MTRSIRTAAVLLSLAGVAATSLPALRLGSAQAETAVPAAAETFPSADAAVTALVDALRQHDIAKLLAILGPGSAGLVESGDPTADAGLRDKFVAAYDEKHSLAASGQDQMTLIVGPNDYPLPLPIVQSNGQWYFDSTLGAQELIDRRIGRNEIAAIRTALACYDAQKLFFQMTKDATGTGEYALHLLSTPGKHDGLYWPATDDETRSPLAPLVEQAESEGYPGAIVAGKPWPYNGYFYHILKAQGRDAPGGRLDYVKNGQMTGGFALVAWPARYGVSGVMTFTIGPDGVVYQKDLGPHTEAIASTMKLYDPDLSWARVDIIQ